MNAYGWKNVFSFTFVNFLKSKSFKVSTVLIVVIIFAMGLCMGLIPALTSLFSGNSGNNVDFGNADGLPQKVYISDSTGITAIGSYEQFFSAFNINIESVDADKLNEVTERLKTESRALLVTITEEESGYYIHTSLPADNSVSQDTASEVSMIIQNIFVTDRYASFGLSAEQALILSKEITATQSIVGEQPRDRFAGLVKRIVPMVSSIALFILIFSYGSSVAQSIAMEKSSKIMELLLTSVRPLAIIIGKVIAMGTIAILQFILMIVSAVLGFVVSIPISQSMINPEKASQAGISITDQLTNAVGQVFSDLSPLHIIVVIVSFILGFAFYALIAGLIGASVSRMEDLNAAMQPYSIIGLLGMYLAYFPAIAGGDNALLVFSMYFPLSSPFSLPAGILTGSIDLLQALLALLALALFTVLLLILVARVYEQIILYSGNRLKIKDIIGLAKNK